MAILHKIRSQPHHKKIRLIWICCGIALVLLIALWAGTWRFRKAVPRDTTLFETIDRGVDDFKSNYNKPIQ